MELDEALGKLGKIGRWQILYYTMISITSSAPACFHKLAIIYIGKSCQSVKNIDFSEHIERNVNETSHLGIVFCALVEQYERNYYIMCITCCRIGSGHLTVSKSNISYLL